MGLFKKKKKGKKKPQAHNYTVTHMVIFYKWGAKLGRTLHLWELMVALYALYDTN